MISLRSGSYVSKFANFPVSDDDQLPDDLVIATVGDIGLVAYKNGKLKHKSISIRSVVWRLN